MHAHIAYVRRVHMCAARQLHAGLRPAPYKPTAAQATPASCTAHCYARCARSAVLQCPRSARYARSATAPCSLRSPLYCSMLRRSLRSHAAWQLCSGCPVSAALRRPATVGAHTGRGIEEALCCAAAWLHCTPAPFRPRGDAAREKPAPRCATLAALAQLRRVRFAHP